MTEEANNATQKDLSSPESDKGGNLGDRSKNRGENHRTSLLGYGLLLLVAVIVGAAFEQPIFHLLGKLLPKPESQRAVLYWASSMDPNERSDKPGKDAMGMDLVPVYAGQEPTKVAVIIDPELSEQDFKTTRVVKGPEARTIHAVSTVAYAEPLIGDVTLKVNAWLDRLYVDYEGKPVRKGDPLLEVYAPDLVSAQQELLISLQALETARKTSDSDAIRTAEENVDSARGKLRYWDVTEEQIRRLEREKKPQKTLTFFSQFSGIVTEKHAIQGKYVPAGQMLYRISDLSRVWVYLSIYADQIHCVYLGQQATLTLPPFPNRRFQGKVIYINPFLEPKSRSVKVRLEFDNPDLVLKPDMFGLVELEPHRMGIGLHVVERAVMETGTRALVYLTRPGDRFEAREVTTGMPLDGGFVQVLAGLKEGEQIVESVNFLMDSESRLRLINRKFQPLGPQRMPMGGKQAMKDSEPHGSTEPTMGEMKGHKHAHSPGH